MTTTLSSSEERAGVRLGREDVERGPGDMAGAERVQQRVLVDQLPRAALTMRTPGFMRAKASASIEPCVSGVSGR